MAELRTSHEYQELEDRIAKEINEAHDDLGTIEQSINDVKRGIIETKAKLTDLNTQKFEKEIILNKAKENIRRKRVEYGQAKDKKFEAIRQGL